MLPLLFDNDIAGQSAEPGANRLSTAIAILHTCSASNTSTIKRPAVFVTLSRWSRLSLRFTRGDGPAGSHLPHCSLHSFIWSNVIPYTILAAQSIPDTVPAPPRHFCRSFCAHVAMRQLASHFLIFTFECQPDSVRAMCCLLCIVPIPGGSSLHLCISSPLI